MDQVTMESVVEEMVPDSPPNGAAETPPQEQPPKLKGRKRLLQGLQRISSSPSMVKLTRSASSGYRGTGAGSISCISLSSSQGLNLWGGPYGTPLSNGYSTAPTSVPTTPGGENYVLDQNVRRTRSNTQTQGTSALPSNLKQASRPETSAGTPAHEEDYFSRPIAEHKPARRVDFDFWGDLPSELRMQILTLLTPREIVRCSAVSKTWHRMCFDGQLWANLDTAGYYRDIPAEGLVKIITYAGPFVRDLNLRGCVQLWESWRRSCLSDACRNLENLSLEGCRIDRNSIHNFLYQNTRLTHINLSGLAGVTNSTMKIIAQCCPRLEHLNVSWCSNIDTRGLRRVAESCFNLRDLRAGELRGLDDKDFMHELFQVNSLERLILMNCDSLTDDSLAVLFEGIDSEIDFLTGRAIVPARKFKHLDFSRCRNITDAGLRPLVGNVPELEGLQLSKCRGLTDSCLTNLFPTTPRLTHLDVEEIDSLTNGMLQELAKSSCRESLQHLNIGYCENLGDSGMLPVVKECGNLRSLDLDNTRISDLVLTEAAAMVRQRCSAQSPHPRRSVSYDSGVAAATNPLAGPMRPKVGLKMAVYDCQNVTWTGIREVLSRNAEIRRPAPFVFPPRASISANASPSTSPRQPAQVPPASPTITAFPLLPELSSTQTRLGLLQTQNQPPSHPHQIIALKVFYGYQPTVTEHTRRVLRGDFASASRLERKWADYMMCTEEASAAAGRNNGGGFGAGVVGLAGLAVGGFGGGLGLGAGMANRRRRRRLREAQMMAADEEVGFLGIGGMGEGGRRRRARSGGGCLVM